MARAVSLPAILLAVGLTLASPARSAPDPDIPRAAQYLVPARGAYLGAYLEKDPAVKNDTAAFETLVGRRHASYLRYVGYGEPFPYRWVQETLARGAMPQIAWEPNNGLSEVQDDAYLKGWAQAAAHAGGPLLLRYASEMNGAWMPYSGDPDEYIRKWRLVYRTFHDAAPNVIVCWCPFGVPRSTIPLYYPGDDYVDWVGVNVYAVVYNNGDVRQPATDTQLDQLRFVYNLYAERKPLAICEYAATHYCKASKQRVTDFALKNMREFYTTLEKQYPRVVFVSWFSVDAATGGLADNDYAVTSDPQVLAAYREITANPYFLAELPPAPEGLGIITPPGPGGAAGPQLAPVAPKHPFPLEGSAAPGAREVAVVIHGASPRAARGSVTISAVPGKEIQVQNMTFYLDDRIRLMTNSAPFSWAWDTSRSEPGEHVIRIEILAPNGEEVAVRQVSVVVAPGETPAD